MNSIPDDVIPTIIINLRLIDIKQFKLTCVKFNLYIIDWETYFNYNVKNSYHYTEKINDYFMKTHGKYLINITNTNMIMQWFKYYNFIRYKCDLIKNLPENNFKAIFYFISKNIKDNVTITVKGDNNYSFLMFNGYSYHKSKLPICSLFNHMLQLLVGIEIDYITFKHNGQKIIL